MPQTTDKIRQEKEQKEHLDFCRLQWNTSLEKLRH